MGKQRRGRDGSADQDVGARAARGGAAGKGHRAAGRHARRAGLLGPAEGNAIMVVVARRDGQEGVREVGRWRGPMNWPEDWEELPILFTGRRVKERGQDRWQWSDERGDRVCLHSATPQGCGMEIKPWAYQRGATELAVMIVANPGARAADASERGLGTHDQGIGQGAGDASRAVDEAFRGMFADMLGREQDTMDSVGLGERGAGAAQSTRGEHEVAGRGQHAGKRNGEADGSMTPSWITRPGAAVDQEWGGRTPDLDHGKPGGSAGGQRDGQGHLFGLWNGPIDIAATVAIAVNAVLIVLDADVNSLGERLLGKVVRGLGGKQLRKELAAELDRIIDARMPAVDDELAGDAGYRAMSQAEQKAVQARARERLEHAVHARARAYFADQAERSEAVAQELGGQADAIAAHHRDVAAHNARAYRALERAAADTGGLDIADPIDAAWSRQGRTGEGVDAESVNATSARAAGVTRSGLTERHHVLPREFKDWFQERGFPGNDIDAYCVQLDIADHQALHGGGNHHLGREWKDEWNRKVKRELLAEDKAKRLSEGRKLNREEVLVIIGKLMDKSPILQGRPFTHYRAKQ